MASCHTIGLEGSSLTEDANLYAFLEELNLSDDTIATTVGAVTSTPLTKRELSQHNRVALLEYLWVCDAGICHVRMHTRLAVPCRTGTCSAGYCFIIAKLPITESQVVHAPLRSGACSKGL